MEKKNSNKTYNFSQWTVKQLKEFAKKNSIKIPTKSKKKDIIELLKEVVSHNGFIDRSQEVEEIEEDLVAGFDDDEDFALKRKEKMELKFWQKPPFSSLLDSELAKESEIAFYDLASLVDEFFDKMLHEDLINYKISGIALKTSASLHHYKISSIIREEEQIQKKEELEKFRQRHSRSIPKALPQPIQPKLQIATKDELFDAMRSAIIEVMQKKEKLKRRRTRREELKQQKIQMKSKAQLPKELLKHITGREQTVQELHDSWYNRIKGTINLNNKETSFFDLTRIIKDEEDSGIGRKFALVRMFLALMFLSTGNKLNLTQDEEFKDISINIRQ
jgi:chromatin segregation and condensation protein Rec8/ScpA/Scc1 (kleisin family)